MEANKMVTIYNGYFKKQLKLALAEITLGNLKEAKEFICEIIKLVDECKNISPKKE